jgi:septum formation protein
MKTIILASASPRRKEILEKTGLKFRVDESDYEENMDIGLKPRELAICHAVGKAKVVASRYKNALIISADTIVVLKNRVFGKPRNRSEARDMLKALSGKVHTVITGYAILDSSTGKMLSQTVESRVFFKRLNEEEIDSYIKSGEPVDKAGAYGVQGLGAVIVKKIDGDFFNVMGLPLNSLAGNLKKFGIRVL